MQAASQYAAYKIAIRDQTQRMELEKSTGMWKMTQNIDKAQLAKLQQQLKESQVTQVAAGQQFLGLYSQACDLLGKIAALAPK
jgi:predicted FMN-binding regulatory protein PaiB